MASAASATTADSAGRPRQRIQSFFLLWVDANVHSSSSDTQNTRKYLRTIVNDVKLLDEPDECLRILERLPGRQSFVIISGAFGKELVPRIHDLPDLDAIYIFCSNKQYHEQWSRVWKKVRAVETDIRLIGKALQKAVQQTNQDETAMSIIEVADSSEADLNRLESSFLYTSLLKDAILSMEHNLKEEMTIFKTNALKKSAEKDVDKAVLDEFQQDYRSDQAIFWYTRETFIYPWMNAALRNLEGNIIVDMGFFIHDLHRQIDQLYEQQLSTFGSKPFNVYRGQGLPREKFEQLKKNKGGLLGFNTFLSVNRNRDVSLNFANMFHQGLENVGLLFVITIDPKRKSTPFADVTGQTAFHGEDEILFSMHTIFRIGESKQISAAPEVHEIQLVLTSEDDPQMKKLHDYLEGSITETGWSRIGRILVGMNQLDKSEEIYRRLLANESNEVNRGDWNHQLGGIKWRQGDYSEAKRFLEKALEIRREVLPDDDGRSADTHSELGSMYWSMGNYHQALSNHERAISIQMKTLPDTHPDFAASYNNIGSVYWSMGNYPQALSNHERAISIQRKTLPDTHPDLALSYHNMGRLYYSMKKYPTALEYLEKALRIREIALPANHPDIASTRQSIAIVTGEMNK